MLLGGGKVLGCLKGFEPIVTGSTIQRVNRFATDTTKAILRGYSSRTDRAVRWWARQHSLPRDELHLHAHKRGGLQPPGPTALPNTPVLLFWYAARDLNLDLPA
jgi:hypothetical protein